MFGPFSVSVRSDMIAFVSAHREPSQVSIHLALLMCLYYANYSSVGSHHVAPHVMTASPTSTLQPAV